MNPHIKATGLFILFAVLTLSIRAADIPGFEFLYDLPEKKEAATLIFEVKETAVGRGENLHTVFIVKAVVIKSELKGLKVGAEFMGYFDRFFSIFHMPESHPLKVGDSVEVGVTEVTKHTISGFLKRKSLPGSQS
jgi:hypothetical protein